jgi:hypothetical protein
MSAIDGQSKPGLWIGGPWLDLVWFSFGWTPLFLALVILNEFGSSGSTSILLVSILMGNLLHRHLTFPLVYGDPEQFRRHRIAYVALPPFFLAVTLASYFWGGGSFYLLQMLAILWTLYHVVMQKVGLLRIYSRKSGVSRLWLDKFLPLAWLGSLVLHAAASPSLQEEVLGLFAIHRAALSMLAAWQSELWVAALMALGTTSLLTALYLRDELRQHRPSRPKILYALSILLLYGTFYYDIGVGYAAFNFSHAIEYIAFVNLYCHRKYDANPPRASLMTRAVRHQAVVMTAYGLLMIAVFWAWHRHAPIALGVYITGSSFLHFIYDGWIWKTREPGVGQPLGISYPR